MVSFTLSKAYVDKPETNEVFYELGTEIASTNIGLPLWIWLLNTDGKTIHEIKITVRVLKVGSKDRVYYDSGVTEEEARALGESCRKKSSCTIMARA